MDLYPKIEQWRLFGRSTLRRPGQARVAAPSLPRNDPDLRESTCVGAVIALTTGRAPEGTFSAVVETPKTNRVIIVDDR